MKLLTGWITGAFMAFCVSFTFLFVFTQIAKPMIRQEMNGKQKKEEDKKKVAANKNNIIIKRLVVRNKDLEHKVAVLELQQAINEDEVIPCSLNLEYLEMQSISLKKAIQKLRLQRLEELRQEIERLDKLSLAWN
jgi:hypothetical protein